MSRDMWWIAAVVPIALCLCHTEERMLILFAVGALVVWKAIVSDSAPLRAHISKGQNMETSARVVDSVSELPQISEALEVSKVLEGGESGLGGKEEEEVALQVVNSRRFNMESLKVDSSRTIKIPMSPIVGFRGQPSQDSRNRLLSRQYAEIFERLHQYE